MVLPLTVRCVTRSYYQLLCGIRGAVDSRMDQNPKTVPVDEVGQKLKELNQLAADLKARGLNPEQILKFLGLIVEG